MNNPNKWICAFLEKTEFLNTVRNSIQNKISAHMINFQFLYSMYFKNSGYSVTKVYPKSLNEVTLRSLD